MEYIYLVPIFIGLIIGMLSIVSSKTSEKKMIDKPFLGNLSNDLYILSFAAPFSWFINPKEDDKKTSVIKKLIVDAGETDKLNYRVYSVIQTITFLASMLLFAITSALASYSPVIIKALFNINVIIVDESNIAKIKLMLGVICLSVCLIPSIYLKQKAKKRSFHFIKQLPILQLFIILMIKANRPLSEVVYMLSKTNTVYKSIFDIAYRKYIRNPKEGLEYISKAFEGTRFEETTKVLEEYSEYSKKDTLSVLENGLKDITEHTNTMKRRKDIGANVLSQISLIVPFLSVILLGFAPFIYYGLSLMDF